MRNHELNVVPSHLITITLFFLNMICLVINIMTLNIKFDVITSTICIRNINKNYVQKLSRLMT